MEQPEDTGGMVQEPTPVSAAATVLEVTARPQHLSWIHSLAGEWQSYRERSQYPQALSGASLLK